MFGWLKNRVRSDQRPGRDAIAPPPVAANGAAVWRAQGEAFLQAGNLPEAIRSFTRALESDPAADIYRDLALLLVRSGRTGEAGELLARGVALHPDSADLHAFSGNWHLHEQRFAQAVAAFDTALALHPEFPEVHYNRGMALTSLGRSAEALESHDAALRVRPGYLAPLLAKGELLRVLGRAEEALATYERAHAVEPRSVPALAARGNMLLLLKRPAEALASFDQALALDARLAEVHHNRGGALRELGRTDEAIESYDRALGLQPGMAQSLIAKGSALRELEHHSDALASYQQALAIDPDRPDVLSNAALALLALKRADEALAMCDRALALRPAFAEALSNRGLILQDLKRPEEALAAYDRALAIEPGLADAHANRGNALQQLARHEEALAAYDRALAIKPDLESTYLNQSLSQLVTGRLPLGWERYEWRWPGKQKRLPIRDFKQPLWLGRESLGGKTVLLYAEQGLGDTIQFCRYARCVADLGARVELEVQAPLKSLLDGLSGVDRVFGRGEALPDFDYHAPLLSLPLAFRTSLESIPQPGAYLDVNSAHAERVRFWRQKLGPSTKPRIGLVWSGNPDHSRDSERSIPLADFLRLTAADAEFVCLQKEIRPGDEPLLRARPDIRRFGAELVDFVETAALISQLDLVISVDTSVAHLAGALGKNVWILLTANPDWRWLLDRSDSPWYQRARLYRQPRPGDWNDVLTRLEEDVKAFAATASVGSGRVQLS